MNNGKVRIYDLSKDLHLENKDILDICEQLNISAKSHSSTITESEAERIRAAAKKYTPTPAGKDRSGDNTNRKTQDTKKQEILAVHHKQNQAPLESKDNNPSQSLVSPPRPPKMSTNTTPTATPPVNRPNSSPVAPKDESLKKPEANAPVSLSPKDADQLESIAPQLLSPPPRNADKVPDGKVSTAKALKKKASPQKSSNLSEKNLPEKKTSPKKPQEGVTTDKSFAKPSQKADLEQKSNNNTAVKPQLKIKRAPSLDNKSSDNKPFDNRKAKAPKEEFLPVEDLDIDDDLLGDEDLLDDDIILEETLLDPPKRPQLKLKRPNDPQKKKEWEEDDDEDLLKNKSKAVAKGKRRPKPLIDEDEDFDELNDSILTNTAFTISTARPPKPKSATPTSPKAPTVATGNKGKKAPSKSDGGSRADKRREQAVAPKLPESVVLPDTSTVRELSTILCTPETDIIRNLFFKGIPVNITETLDYDTCKMVAEELGINVVVGEEIAAATKVTEMLDVKDLENLHRRPPVVTIMGHVDHGKTTLLDSIRKTKVAQGEAGGITQHIGAYHVDVEHNGKMEQIVFLDTPGHEAFTAMRARGARVTDIAILVVAADDGVQPQTREAISHAKAAEVPLLVAINKVDKVGAEPDRIKQELTELGLVAEEWGGDTIMVPVSALKGENLDTLLEMILLVAEVEELSANPDREAKGTVIEAHLDRTRGPVATLLVQNGTLRVGDTIVVGSVLGKIRAMIDDRGDKVDAATPSFAVEVLGLNNVPEAGDEFDVFTNEKEARVLAETRQENKRLSNLQQSMSSPRVTLTSLSAKAQEGELKQLNLILKADVQGSVEAILGSLKQLPQGEVQLRVLLASPGEVTETDVDLAAASGAVVIGFNTTLASGARAAADVEGVDVREYNIIYKLLDDIQGAMEGLLDPEEVEESLGKAEVRAVFSVGKGAVAGCYILSGKVIRNRMMRVRRKDEVIYEGILDSLKRFNEDAKEVAAGYECGMGCSKFNTWQEGDIIEVYQMVMKRRTLAQ
jgi:translation initiation factor IF-2